MPQPGKAVGHMLPLNAPSSTSQPSDQSGAIVSLFAKRYCPVQHAAHERVQLVLVNALLLGGGLRPSANSSSGFIAPSPSLRMSWLNSIGRVVTPLILTMQS